MLRKLLLSFTLSAAAFFATAQNSSNNGLTPSEIENMTWVEAMQDYRVNFHTVVDKFETEFAGKPYEKGHGWKQFKRWEYMMGQRVGETGVRPHPSVLYNAIQSQSSSNEYGDWRPAGPFDAPSGEGIGRINNVAFHPQHNDTIYAGAPSGGLWVSYDDGQTWQTFTDELTNIGVSDLAIDPQHPDTMYLATGDRDDADTYSFGLMKSVDGGVTWSATGLSFNVSNNYRIGRVLVHPDSTNIVVAATNGGIYRSTNYGQTFSLEQSGLFYGVHMGHGDTLFATTSGSSPKVYRSVNAGDSWTQMSSGLPTSGVYRCEVAVSSVPGLLYAVFGDSNYGFGGLYRSTNGGSNWSLMSSTPNIMGWSSTGGGSGGQAWYDLSIACDPLNENTVYVGGINIWKSTNGGANWSIVGHWYGAGSIPFVHADHHHASFRPGTSQLYVGTDGGVYKTANGGSSWSHLNDGMNITQYYKISQSTSDTTVILAGAQDNGSHLRSSSTWSRVTEGDGMDNGVDVTNDNIMYTSMYYGDFYKSTNGGGFFSAINTLSPSGSGNWVTPFNVDPVNGNTIYAGFDKLWKSTNAGASWTATSSSNVSGGSNIDEFEIAPSNTNYIYVLVNSNIFKSSNGGSTWSNITPSGGLSPSPHNISGVAIDPDDEQHIVISISGYTSNKKVMESFNGGQTWSNLSSGLPNIPANCVTFESGSSDGIYVGTDIGVYYHSAAFSNWVSYNKNLPNVIVVDFEIYEDDELLRIGTYGRGVWQSPLMAGSAAPPVAAFMADPAAPCGTLDTISLIDQSQGLTTSWQWQISPSTFSYVNGTTDTSQNPQVVFSATGGYTVTLTATNAYGSDDTTVFQAISVGGAALPFVEDFENGLSGWEIDNPDGGITWASTTLNGTSPGTVGMFMNHYSYSGSGQRDELISPALDFSNDTLVSMSFEYASAYYSSGLSDSLLVHVSDDCGATWNEVGAYDATDASFTTAGAITSSFAPADSTYWCHGSSSVTCPTIDLDAYSGKSGIRVKFVAVNGYGNNTFLDNINISGQAQVAPVAAFGGDTAACTGKSVTFYDYSAPAPTARLWSFQGGTPATSTAANPTVTYANAGTYDVKLVVSNAAGIDSVLLTNYITILTAPNAIAQLDTLATLTDCAPFIIDTSVIKANHFSGNYYYIWNIFTTNGNLVTSFNGRNSLNYTITDDDTSFVVQLIVTSEYGCLNDTVNITISTIENPNPYWSLATNQGCAPFTPDIDSLAADATLTHSWIITSSTGTILYNLNGTNPTWPALNNNSYTANQPYTIKHIVQAGTGCKDSLELTVNVLPTPLAAFNVDSAACAPWTPTIINYSFGNNLTYDWDISPLNNLVSFSDTSNTIPTLSFADLQWPDYNQQYLLSLTTTSDSGCADAYTDTITLYSRPKAGFQLPTDSCGRFTLTPNDTSKTFNNITQWLWRLSGPNGDTTSTSNAPVFNLAPTYNGNHNYSLTLIVTDNNGCQDSTTENFQAFFPPMADVYLQSYTCDSTNINEILSYYAYPFDSCYNLTYDWTIDSAGTNLYTITDSIPNYILTNNDTTIISYTVTLTVTDCNGCQTTTTDTVQVLPFPNASFTIQSPPLTASGNVGSACAPWTPSISYNPVGVNFYAWTIDSAGTNIATSINSIPNYTFNNSSGTPVTYTLYLYATNQYGCSSWETQDIVVNSPSYFTQSVSSCGSYTWIDGNTYSSSTSTPTYTLTGSNGCDSVVTLNLVVVNIIPTIQRNADTIFTTSGYDLYSWYKCGSPNYQLLGTTTDHWFVVASNGDYAVSITEGNCQDTTLCLTIEDLGEKELLQPKIKIYPNPADGCVLIDKTDYTGEVYMTISSADGRVLLRERPVSNDSIIKIDVKSYASGSYIITLIGKDFSSHYTIQISH